MLKINKKKIKPYGDRLDDGRIQLSFTLPVDASPEALEAARIYVEKMGLKDVHICAMEPMGKGFAYFVAYASASHTIDMTRIKVSKVEHPYMDFETLKAFMGKHFEKPIVVIGAATGSDAHTVGIDAIMNMKGYDHDYGLERYPLFKAINLRSQLTNEQLLDKAVELGADAILISQVVTQRDSHIKNLKAFHDLWKKDKRITKKAIVIVGGPRLDHASALKLGFDAGFGPGTKPSQVANFIIHEYMKRYAIRERKPDAPPAPIAEQVSDVAVVKSCGEPKAHAPAKPSAEKPLRRTDAVSTAPTSDNASSAPKKRTRRGRRGGKRRKSALKKVAE
jgi:beta-lysine 5,6-aminomutase beta subunit